MKKTKLIDLKDIVIISTLAAGAYLGYQHFFPKLSETQRLSQTKSCVNCNLSSPHRPNLNHKDLQNFNFTGSNLSYQSLVKCDLRNTNFQNTYLKGASFYHSDLTGANFAGADIRNANFNHARLKNINWKGAIYNKTTTGVNRQQLFEAGAIMSD